MKKNVKNTSIIFPLPSNKEKRTLNLAYLGSFKDWSDYCSYKYFHQFPIKYFHKYLLIRFSRDTISINRRRCFLHFHSWGCRLLLLLQHKVLSFLEACFDLISSPSPSTKIQITGGKINEKLGFNHFWTSFFTNQISIKKTFTTCLFDY